MMASADDSRLLTWFSANSALFWDQVAPRTRRWDDAWAADTGLPIAMCNSATPLLPVTGEAAGNLVERLDAFFDAAPGGPWILWSAWPAPALAQHGLTLVEQPPIMIRIVHGAPVPAPPELRIEEVTTSEELATFERCFVNWYPVDGYPELPSEPFFPSRSLGTTHRYWMGYERNEPVAVGMTVVSKELVGIYAVATAPSARGKGYGGALTDLAARCAQGLPALLKSSSLGFPVYERIGFRRIGEFDLWLRERKGSGNR